MALPAFTRPEHGIRERSPAARRPLSKRSLGIRLVLLVAGTTLPLIVFAAGLVYHQHIRDREAASERVLDTVRGIRLVLDSEMQSLTSALQVLALSEALQHDDIAGFRREVDVFLSQYPDNLAISLADRSGRQLLNTRAQPGDPLPPRVNRETLDEVFRTGRPAFSKLITGSVSGQPLVTIDVPVYRYGQIVYEIAFAPSLTMFQKIIERQRPSAEWTVAIFDQAGVNFARAPHPELTVGRAASPTLLAELLQRPEAKLITTSLEGVELFSAFTRSSLSGWSVAAGIPTATVTAPLWRTLAVTAAIGSILLVIGLSFAILMAARIARAEALHGLLIDELNHRVKNTLATVQSVAWQTFRGVAEPAEARNKLDARLAAFGRTHDILSEQKWESADLREVVDGVLEPYRAKEGQRLHACGPEVRLTPRSAVMFSMALHELATNAAKYGALSNGSGEIFIDWSVTDGKGKQVRLDWREAGGPPVGPVRQKGFGSALIERGFAAQVDGRVTLDFPPTGVRCTLECPVD